MRRNVTCDVARVGIRRMHRMSLMRLHSGHLDRVLLILVCTGFGIWCCNVVLVVSFCVDGASLMAVASSRQTPQSPVRDSDFAMGIEPE